MISAAAAIGLLLAGQMFDVAGVLITLLVVVIVLAFDLVMAIWALAKRHPKRALSALGGMALIASDAWLLPIAAQALDDYAFSRDRAAFDSMVAREREREPAGQPIRMVVKFEDRSGFVTSTLFEFIIYDETDRAGTDAGSVAGYWPYPGSTTGVISVDGDKTIRHIEDHYYDVSAS